MSETARERTMARLESLMRKTALVGTGVLLSSCRPFVHVVDPPPPPPPECCENPDQFMVHGCVRSEAVWENVGGKLLLRLSLDAGYRGIVGFEGLNQSDIKVSGMVLGELTPGAKAVVLVLVPAGEGTSATVELPVTCNDKKVPFKLSLDLTGGAAEKRSVPVTQVK
ncbi:MAG TPA: hypothetical protein VN893_14175 [Bryobacteraceae bacterium]|nr:hypothetical protein [Bryobacteraceae bacterium]